MGHHQIWKWSVIDPGLRPDLEDDFISKDAEIRGPVHTLILQRESSRTDRKRSNSRVGRLVLYCSTPHRPSTRTVPSLAILQNPFQSPIN